MTRVMLLTAGLLLVGDRVTVAQATPDAVESAQQGLRKIGNVPWYDDRTDSMRPVAVAPRVDPPPPRAWIRDPKPKQPRANWNLGATFWRIMQVLSWALVIGICIYLLILIARSAWLDDAAPAKPTSHHHDDEVDMEKLDQLPFELRSQQQGLLARARASYESGNFGDAIVLLFSYQLLQLDKYHRIRLVKGKTNRQYLRELGNQAEIQSVLRTTMVAFEDFFFGGHALTKERFEQSWNQVERFHRLVQPAQAAT